MSKDAIIWMEVSLQICNFYFQQAQAWTKKQFFCGEMYSEYQIASLQIWEFNLVVKNHIQYIVMLKLYFKPVSIYLKTYLVTQSSNIYRIPTMCHALC